MSLSCNLVNTVDIVPTLSECIILSCVESNKGVSPSVNITYCASRIAFESFYTHSCTCQSSLYLTMVHQTQLLLYGKWCCVVMGIQNQKSRILISHIKLKSHSVILLFELIQTRLIMYMWCILCIKHAILYTCYTQINLYTMKLTLCHYMLFHYTKSSIPINSKGLITRHYSL